MSRDDSSRALRVAVLSGGDSPEREISLASGICVAAALEEMGHQVGGIDPARVDLRDVDWRRFDACFIALHGGAGEDGRVQETLAALGVPYTGSGPAASRRAMSKSASKACFAAHDIPTPEAFVVDSDTPIQTALARADEIGYPLIVKPDAQGSSLGVGLVLSRDELQCQIAECQLYDDQVLVERYIAGREFTVAVIGREPLPLLEILTTDELLSYDAKYQSHKTEYLFDSGLGPAHERRLQQLAVAVCEALETEGLARVDLRLDSAERPWVLELNSVPGMTERSLAPRAAAQIGLDMPELCDRLVRACLVAEMPR